MAKQVKYLVLLIIHVFIYSFSLYAQIDNKSFLKYQLSIPRVSKAWAKYNDSTKKEFAKSKIDFPPYEIYLRAFKAQNELELWARNNDTAEYTLIKTLRVCAICGVLGPKRARGDNQIPEGFYYIEEFNPKSEFYLSLHINYPNYIDKKVSLSKELGGDIYMHGGCVTIGCIPMTDEGIQELYVICLNAKSNGQNNIPVHIFPTRFTKNGMNYLKREYGKDKEKIQFWNDLKGSYDYFEKYHKLLPLCYTIDGRYLN